jgi:hypothetical protein
MLVPRSDRLPVAIVAVATSVILEIVGLPVMAALAMGAGIVLASTIAALTAHVRWSVFALRARAEARDPAGPLLGLLVGMAVLLATGSVPAALGSAVAVMALKIVTAAVLRPAEPPRPRLAPGSAAATWLERAERAVEAIGRIGPGRESDLAERFSQTRDGARETLALIRRLASHELVVSQVIAGIDPRTAEELRRLEHERADAPTLDIDEEIGRAIGSVRDQIAARERLVATDRTLIARMRSAALGLEGLVARLGEIAVLAQGGAAATANARVDELADELDALRAGLAEADALARVAVHELRPTNSLTEGIR